MVYWRYSLSLFRQNYLHLGFKMQTRERGRERNLPMSISNLVSQPSRGHNRARSRGDTTSGLSLWVMTYLVTHESAQEVLPVFLEAISTRRWLTSNYQAVHRSDYKPHDHKPKLSGSWFTFYPYHQCLWSCHFRTGKWVGGVRIQERVRVASSWTLQCFRTCGDSRLTDQTLHSEAAWR